MVKTKAKAKEMGVTFNDLVLGIVSKCVKAYFVEKGDNTEHISISVPFTF